MLPLALLALAAARSAADPAHTSKLVGFLLGAGVNAAAWLPTEPGALRAAGRARALKLLLGYPLLLGAAEGSAPLFPEFLLPQLIRIEDEDEPAQGSDHQSVRLVEASFNQPVGVRSG